MSKSEQCELIRGARVMAKERGLPPNEVSCFWYGLATCTGKICEMISKQPNPDQGGRQMTRFIDRLKKYTQIHRL